MAGWSSVDMQYKDKSDGWIAVPRRRVASPHRPTRRFQDQSCTPTAVQTRPFHARGPYKSITRASQPFTMATPEQQKQLQALSDEYTTLQNGMPFNLFRILDPDILLN